MRFRQALLNVNGKMLELRPNRSNTFDPLYVDFQFTESVEAGVRYTVFIHPKQDISIQGLELQFELKMPPGTRFFVNGYQSADASRWMYPGEGKMRSWTYTCIRQGEDEKAKVTFLGSLSERTGFTQFDYDPAAGLLTVRKDLGNLLLRHSFPALDFWSGEGHEAEMFAMFARLAEVQPRQAPKHAWSSRYLSRDQTGQGALLQHLEDFAQAVQQCPENIRPERSLFMIDEGWEQRIGDWIPVQGQFPGGLASLSGNIREKGMIPGLWIAPFVAAPDATLVKKNPEWVLKDAKGNPMKIPGKTPLYALNFYHDGLREYLSGVFHLMFDKWGFECLRMAHLYAVALAPPPGKTQGAVMWEAMEFLRDLAGSRYLWASDAPMGACMGNVDYWDPGPAIAGQWGARKWWNRRQPKEGALQVLNNTLHRRRLNGTLFSLAADVCSFNIENQGLNAEQQQSYLAVQALLGGLLNVTGAFGKYSELQKAEWEEGLSLRGKLLEKVIEQAPGVWVLVFLDGGRRWSAYVNLNGKEKTLSTANGQAMFLRPFETIVLKT